ncbi:CD177 antigen isoform X2 [Meriones unguiculatus]|uniref:CD177 antigen isoform X2 n=1 Tax=Meriones unguiculatus TaxID=10047 RepID=UPI00293F043E|nr:CD177 antigen isoform X2 [Meriones unguiculatus]
MSPVPVLALLGVITLLPCGVPALNCHGGVTEMVRTVSALPLEWESERKACQAGEACRELVLLLENGPQVHLVSIKDCAKAEDQAPRVTWLSPGPGLSLVAYTRVCRHGDFCNDVSSTAALGGLPKTTGQGTLRCPLCLSKNGCENAPEQVCPAGTTHCYSGVLSLRGAAMASELSVQGCMPQAGCSLLGGAQEIGPLVMREKCGSWSGTVTLGLKLPGPLPASSSPIIPSDLQQPRSPGKKVQEPTTGASGGLKCQHGTLRNANGLSELPLSWTAGQTTCNVGEGCQDTLMMIENGEQVLLVLSKGCTSAEDQEAKVTEHRAGPGLSVTSYTAVCRRGHLCNDLSSTAPLWAPPPVTAPGTLRCPLCLSAGSCSGQPVQVCPAGTTHCYSGVLSFGGEEVFSAEILSDVKIQGCMTQPGCTLLNGTRKIGPVDVGEACQVTRTDTLTCHKGVMLKSGSGLAEKAEEWVSSTFLECEPGELCQETLLLIDVGQRSVLIGSKGCSRPVARPSPGVSLHSQHPGMLVASYFHFCSSPLCNAASSSSVLLSSLPRPAAPTPGSLQCPACVELFGSCPQNTRVVTCPQGATHCYQGAIGLQGGGLTSGVSIRGCMASPTRSLLGNSKAFGIFSAEETPEDGGASEDASEGAKGESKGGASTSSASSLAWLLGLGLFLALCLEGFVLYAEPIFLPSLIPAGLPCPPSPDVTT